MKRRILVCLSVLFVLAASAGAGDFDFLLSSGKLIDAQTIIDQFEAGESQVKVIVNLAEPVQMKARTDWDSVASVSALRGEIAGRQEPVLGSLPCAEFSLRHRFETQAGFSGEVTVEGLEKLLNDPSVVSVEPVRVLEFMLAQGIPLINAITARLTYDGQGAAVAIVDTGVDYTHPMFGGGGFPNAKVIGGYDIEMDDPDPMPWFWDAHGTCCAGIAAGDLGAVGDYIGGVAHGAKIYALKIAGYGTFVTFSDSLLRSWDWCVVHKNDDPQNPIMAISNSIGWPLLAFNNPAAADALSPAVTIAADTATTAGITILAASGNNGFTGQGILWPSAMSNVISVGAVYDATYYSINCLEQAYPDVVACYSNAADILDILAPSEQAYTTDIVGPGGYNPTGDYTDGTPSFQLPDGYFNGTSAACPYAAGAVAALQSAAVARTGIYLTPAEVKDLLITYGDPIVDRRGVRPLTKPRVNLGRAIDNIADVAPPLPDPAEWALGLEPKETGRFTIAMEANEATDDSGIEYYFECVNDVNFDSGWQNSLNSLFPPGYVATGLDEGTTYAFRVKYRDTSPNQNETDWSVPKSATTDANSDTSSPFPDPSRWAMEPRKFTDTMIGMAAKISSDENEPVKYYFDCTVCTDPCIPDANVFDSGWQISESYLIGGLNYATYTFRVKARDNSVNQNETAWSSEASVTLAPPPRVLEVPSVLYEWIQEAINDASFGDTVLVHPGTYTGVDPQDPNRRNVDLDFLGKAITVRSENPEEESVVAATIIDCAGSATDPHRAFIFQSGEGTDSVVAGFTIINGYIAGAAGTDGTPLDPNGTDGGDASGGAIICIGSSPTIRYCIIDNCVVEAGNGGNGVDGIDGIDYDPGTGGDPNDPNYVPPTFPTDGTDGGDSGSNGVAYGGGIYCDPNSDAIIYYCGINNCRAIGGSGGNGGNGGNGGTGDPGATPPVADCNGGDGGDGSDAFVRGGGICFDTGSNAIISICTISDCYTVSTGTAGTAGTGGTGDPPGIDGIDGASDDSGGGVYLGAGYASTINYVIVSGCEAGEGGGIYCEGGVSRALTLDNCNISDSVANLGDGGGIWFDADPNSTLTLKNCSVSDSNAIVGSGGGIWFDADPNSALTLDNCNILGNDSNSHGGGIWYSYGGWLRLNNCDVSDNNVPGDQKGGGIYGGVGGAPLVGTSIELNNSIVSGNTAQYGGGIYVEDTILTIKDSSVSGNTARADGGGMCLVEADLTIDDFTISDNNAVYGGGAYWVNSVADFNSGTISGNVATGGAYSSGGGFYCDDSSTTIKNCVLTENQSDGSGGAVCFMGGYPAGGTHEVTNCLITDNNAFMDGAGLSCNVGAMPTITNCTIVGNTVPGYYGSGGGVSCYDAFTEIVDDILWENTAAYGPQIAIGDPLETNNPMATVLLSYSDVEGGPGAVFEGQGLPGMGPMLILWPPGTVIDADPNFAITSLTEQNYNYYLSQTDSGQLVNSLCVDAGDPSSTLVTTYLTTRTNHVADVNSVIDMGYHYDAGVPPIQYWLTITVVNSVGGRLKAWAGGYDPFEIWDPNTRLVNPGTIVDLEAIPNSGYEVQWWTGTDDDTSWDPCNTVTMYSDKYVTVEFREPQAFYVPAQYQSIQAAMDAAFPHGDTVVVSDGTYSGSLDFRGKSITVVSERPDDPCYVAATIIDCQGYGNAFIFRGGEKAPDAVIDGFTIINGNGYPVFGFDPFQGYYYDAFGGAIYGFGESSPLISNCVVRNCMAQGRDGYDGLDRTPDNIPDGPGGDGTPGGSGFGGAIYFDANSSPTIRNCKFIGSAALGGRGGSGGHAKGADEDTGIGFPGGWAADGGEAYGGAMYFGPGCKPMIENCIISDSNTLQGMGNVGGNGGDGDPGGPGGAGSVNGDESWGGAILYRENCEPTVLDTIIINSTASTEVGGYYWPGGEGGDQDGPDGPWGFSYTSSYGGAHYYDVNCTSRITNCTISDSAVISDGVVGIDGHGGAEYYQTNCNSKITDCNFINGTAGDNAQANGGILFFETDCVVDINNSAFVSGLAPGLYSYGGAIYWHEADAVTINNSYFVESEATYGGALAWYDPGSDIVISNCIIMDNIADHGGGLLWYDGAPTIRGCKIRRNTAEKRLVAVEYGLIIFATPLAYAFEGEFYGGGGGIFCWTSDAIIEDCVIEDNTASGSGGGVYFGGDTSSPILKNCLVKENSAVLDGGGIVSYWFTRPTISNCTIVDNTVYDPEDTTYHGRGGGLCCSYESKTILSDSILWGNSGSSGNQILIGSVSDPNIIQRPAELTVSHCDIQGGQSPQAIHVEPGRILNWLSGNIAENPLFVPGPLGDYYLSQMAAGQGNDSPCVDAGSANANDPNIGLDTYTTRTDSFPDAGTVDMGYHYGDASGLRTVQLTVTVVGGHGTAEPTEPDPISYDPVSGVYTYYRGTAVIITATPEAGYRVASWSGTINDASTALTNIVVMSSDKAVSVQFGKPRVISVPADYPTIQRAIDAAEEGDQIIISPGLYRHPGYEHGASLHLGGIVIWGKNITLSSTNPDDPNVVAATILQGYQIMLYEVGPETVLTGFTMWNTNWFSPSGIDGPDPGDSGSNGAPIRSGAIDIIDASPTLVNIVIDDVSITAGDGGDGANGDGSNVNGGNGGWGGSAYGGAFYIENGNPTFKGVTVINCAATGGDGGDGGNGNGDPPGYGGRGGSWTFKENDEEWWEALGLGWVYPRDRYGYPLYLYIVDADGNIIGTSTFGTYDDYWLYTAMGAAVYVDATSEPTFIDCTFEDNRTESGYCGVGGIGGAGLNDRWPDYHHRLESFGTGIYCEVGSAPTFIDCNFTDNVADSDVPTENHSSYMTYGGGLACGTLTHKENPGSAHSPKLINCTFTDNSATIGGGVFWTDTAPTIEDCNFIDNYAYQGGAMYCGDDSTPIIVGSTFTQNDTGYVYIDDPNLYYDVSFSSPDITLQVGPPIEDVLGLGGGMVCFSSRARIIDCQFNINTASCSGGGIYTTGSEAVLVKNCLITENTADRDGGGISVNWNSEPNIINCTIADNLVTGEDFIGYGGGVCCSSESYAVITNSIIWGNYALNGWDLAVSTGFEHDPRPATVKVVYSDIKGGEPAVFVDTGCTLYWDDLSDPNYPTNLSGTSDDAPIFVSDYLGDNRYYLSQPYVVPPDPNQTELSPCVDVGSTDAYLLDMYRHTTRTDRILDAGTVDIGYHYLLTTDLVGDFDFNYMVNMSDLVLFLLRWLEEDCGPPDWCHGADFSRDGIVNFVDYTIFVENYGLSDTTPPEPDPMTWAAAPNSIGPTSIYMAATTAYDNATGPYVEYYFNCIYAEPRYPCTWTGTFTSDIDGSAGIIEDWIVRDDGTTGGRWTSEAPDGTVVYSNDASGTYTYSNGQYVAYCTGTATEYGATSFSSYSLTLNLTGTIADGEWTLAGTYVIDFAEPSWGDDTGTWRVSGDILGPFDSGWQADRTYQATGLTRGTEYGFRVKARDTSSNRNETEWSIIGYAVAGEDVTPPLTDPNALNPYQSTWAMPPIPSSGTSIYMVATTATDESGVEYYFENTFGDGNDSGWQDSPIYEDTGLDPNTMYAYRVRARDKWDPPNQNYGFWSDEAFATTPESQPPLPDPAQWLTPPTWVVDPNTGWPWHYMEAEPADDAATGGNNPCWYYFECVSGNGLDSGWQASNIYTYFHTSPAVYVVRYSDSAGFPLLVPPLRAPGNVGQDSISAYTGPRP